MSAPRLAPPVGAVGLAEKNRTLARPTSTGSLARGQKAFRLPRQNVTVANTLAPAYARDFSDQQGLPTAWSSGGAGIHVKQRPVTSPSDEFTCKPSSPAFTESSMTSFPTLLPPGAISPYDENSRLRRELHGLKKRYRALEVEIKREPISRTQLLREVYTGVPQSDESQPLPATTDEQMEIALTRLNDQWEGELKKVSAEYENKVADAERVRDEAIDQMKAFRKQSDAQVCIPFVSLRTLCPHTQQQTSQPSTSPAPHCILCTRAGRVKAVRWGVDSCAYACECKPVSVSRSPVVDAAALD